MHYDIVYSRHLHIYFFLDKQLPLLRKFIFTSNITYLLTVSKTSDCIHLARRKSVNRGSYMNAHVLLNLLNELGKRDKMRLINSIIQEHEC